MLLKMAINEFKYYIDFVVTNMIILNQKHNLEVVTMKKDLRINVRADRNMVNDLDMLSTLLNLSDGKIIELALNILVVEELKKRTEEKWSDI